MYFEGERSTDIHVIPRLQFRVILALADYPLHYEKEIYGRDNGSGWMTVTEVGNKAKYKDTIGNLYPVLDRLVERDIVELRNKRYIDKRRRQHKVKLYRLKRDNATRGLVYDAVFKHMALNDWFISIDVEELRTDLRKIDMYGFVFGENQETNPNVAKDWSRSLNRKIDSTPYYNRTEINRIKAHIAHMDKMIRVYKQRKNDLLRIRKERLKQHEVNRKLDGVTPTSP